MLSLAGAFGPYAVWQDDLAWHYHPVADLSRCCSDEMNAPNKFFPLMHAVVGYQSKPTPIILILYCGYWAIVLAVSFFKWRNGSLFESNAVAKRKRTALKLSRAAAAAERRAAAAEQAARLAAGGADAGPAAARAAAARAEAEAARAAHAAELRRLEDEDEAAMRAAGGGGNGDSASGSGSDDFAVVVGDIEGGKDVEAGPRVVEMGAKGDGGARS
jgi:hypothetical protein